jgi:hypothetical protein
MRSKSFVKMNWKANEKIARQGAVSAQRTRISFVQRFAARAL